MAEAQLAQNDVRQIDRIVAAWDHAAACVAYRRLVFTEGSLASAIIEAADEVFAAQRRLSLALLKEG